MYGILNMEAKEIKLSHRKLIKQYPVVINNKRGVYVQVGSLQFMEKIFPLLEPPILFAFQKI